MELAWDHLKTILLVVRHGTLAGAATALKVNYTTVARRIEKAEAALGEPLFERLADGYRPTDAASQIAQHAADMERAEHRLLRERAGRDRSLRGTLTVTAPQLLIAHVLAPVIDRFARTHPLVHLRFRASNELLDLSRREADLAIRISRNPGDALKGRRLSAQETGYFATAPLIRAMQEDPTAYHQWVVYEQYSELPKEVLAAYPRARIRVSFDDMAAMAGAAQAGLGAVRMPLFLGRALPELQPVPNLPVKPYADIWAVAHEDVWPSAKVQAFQTMLADWFRENRGQFMGENS